jgi:hypothetical protein
MAAYDVVLCGSASTVTVEFGSITPNINEIWSFSSMTGVYCGTIIQPSLRLGSYGAITQYDTCFDCITGSSLYNSYMFQECGIIGTIYIDPTSFGSLPDIKDVFELTIESRGIQKTSCYTFIGVAYSNSIPGFPEQTLMSSTPYISCELCQFSANSVTFEVQECGSENVYYVTAPTSAGPVISFIPDGTLDQICGTIPTTADTTPTAVYLSTFDRCATCQEQSNSKREIISCIDGTVNVVYTSALYNVGESGYITVTNPEQGTSNCYTIGNETESDITITDYLSYQPSVSCDECIACNGYYIEYTPCVGEGSFVSISYQYIMTGQTFIHPVYGCCEVTGYATIDDANDIELFSFYEYNGNCESGECSAENYETWISEDCVDNVPFLITVPSGASQGEIYTLKQGDNGVLCVTLVELFGEGSENPGVGGISSEISYASCTSCNDSQIVGVTLVECNTTNTTKATMTLSDYQSIDRSSGIFRLSNYKCYYILDDCNKDENYPLVSVLEFFESCEACNQPLSAGTEVTFCEQICTDSGTTVVSVTVPHPVWTNNYGKDVIQLGMVTLGGINGLNS